LAAGRSVGAFDYSQPVQEPPLTEAGPISAAVYGDRIEYFPKRVVPVAHENQARFDHPYFRVVQQLYRVTESGTHGGRPADGPSGETQNP